MAGSLQDQLLKAGLVTEEQIEKARPKPKPPFIRGKGKPKGKPNPGRGKRRDGPSGDGARADQPARPSAKPNAKPSDAAAPPSRKEGASAPEGKRRRRSRGGKPAAAKPVQGQSQLSPEERALRDKVHGLITDSTQSREGGETPYHFVKGSRVKRIYVTDEQRGALASSELAVAAMKGKHYLIPMTVAEEIKSLVPGYFIAMGSVEANAAPAENIDDEYAEFQVPDDLTW
jgi:uncharacterized protein YaiL (DUF2058 family)